MKKIIFCVIVLFIKSNLFSQVGIGTTNPQSSLDIRSSNQSTPSNSDGLLIPKVDIFPITNPTIQQHGMLVYLTTTSGSNTPGFYYWNNPTTTWLPLASGDIGWSLTGNAATDASTNFLGTTDAQPLIIRTNNTEKIRVQTNGNVGIGVTNPFTRLDVSYSNSSNFATVKASGVYDARGYLGVQGQDDYDSFITADWDGLEIGVVGLSMGTSSTDNIGVLGHSNAVGIRAEHSNGSNWAELGTSLYGGNFNGRVEMQSTNDASGAVGSGVLEIANSLRFDGNEIITNTDSGLYINSGNNGDVIMDGATFRMDASENRIGIGDITPDAKIDSYTTVYEPAIMAQSTIGYGGIFRGQNVDPVNAGWWFCFGTGAVSCGGNETNFTGPAGIISGGRSVGVLGVAELDALSTTDHAGGNFITKTSANVVRAMTSVGADINGTVFKVVGFGTVSTLVEDTEGKGRIMHAPETPEALFQDYGEGQLINGKAIISLDPILSKNIIVDKAHPLRVFIQLKGDCKGTYVTKESNTGFEVIELQGGSSNAKFSWSVTANRKDQMIGGQISKYQDLRFEPLKDPKFNTKDAFIENSSVETNTKNNSENNEISKSEITPVNNESNN